MKVIELLQAQTPLKRLTEKNFNNYKVLRELAKLRKAVEAEVEFYTEQERKAVELYADKDDKGQPVILGNGRIKLKNIEAKQAFDEELTKLRALEVDGITKVVVGEGDFRSSADYPTPDEMLALECVIDFN